MTYKNAIKETQQKLRAIYDDREALSIANALIFNITIKKYLDGLMEHYNLTDIELLQLQDATILLLTGKPLQYITGETYWSKYTLHVNENCLIPRTETEELLEWIIAENKNATDINIIDIGTGSGCLAIGLKDFFKHNTVYGTDISLDALDIAKKNAVDNNVNIEFIQHDILKDIHLVFENCFDIIVSNPPYIEHHEKEQMHKNVLEFEPHNALFVTDGDAMQFYKAIIEFCKTTLNKGGKLYFETSATNNKQVATLLATPLFDNIVRKKDMHGNWRMVSACKIS
jgi:release factor glutamine methyltransferase